MNLDDRLRSELGGLTVPAGLVPPADLADTVLARSRRQTRQRGLAAPGGLAVAVAVAATAPAWVPPQPTPGAAPPLAAPTDPACSSAPPPTSPSPTWEYFDPLTFQIDASGVAGYQLGYSTTSTYFQHARLFGDGTHVDVGLFATGGEPATVYPRRLVDPTAGDPADPVHGASTYWLPNNTAALAWEWAPGAWAIVEPVGPVELGRDGLRAIARQVAEQLEFGTGTPVRFPFSLPVPDCLYPAFTEMSGTGIVQLGFDPVGTVPPTNGFGYRPRMSVNAYIDYDIITNGNAYPADIGYPAYRTNQPDGTDAPVLWVPDVDGVGIEIEARHIRPTQRVDYAADVFRTIRVYPGAATDQSTWGEPITR